MRLFIAAVKIRGPKSSLLLKGRDDVTGSREHTQKSCYFAYSVYYSAMCSWTLSLSYLLLTEASSCEMAHQALHKQNNKESGGEAIIMQV